MPHVVAPTATVSPGLQGASQHVTQNSCSPPAPSTRPSTEPPARRTPLGVSICQSVVAWNLLEKVYPSKIACALGQIKRRNGCYIVCTYSRRTNHRRMYRYSRSCGGPPAGSGCTAITSKSVRKRPRNHTQVACSSIKRRCISCLLNLPCTDYL